MAVIRASMGLPEEMWQALRLALPLIRRKRWTQQDLVQRLLYDGLQRLADDLGGDEGQVIRNQLDKVPMPRSEEGK